MTVNYMKVEFSLYEKVADAETYTVQSPHVLPRRLLKRFLPQESMVFYQGIQNDPSFTLL